MISINSNRARRALLVGGAVVAALLIFLLGRVTSSSSPGDGEAAAHAHGQDDTQMYYCSMHPDQQTADPNASCPICGMDMVPMPSDADSGEDGDAPVLRMSERSAALMRVEVAPAYREHAGASRRFQGHVELDETRLADVVARSDGFVERQYAEYKWQPVRRGQPLAHIYSPAVTAAARELLVIGRAGAGRSGHVTIESGKEKLRRLGAPESYIEKVLETGDVPRTYALRSPMSGVITEVEGRQGQAIAEGQRHVQIADLSHVWVQLQAYETDLPGLRVGQSAQVTTQAHPGETFEGKIAFIDPAVDASMRTVRVRLEVANPEGRLKPGMFARGVVTGQAPEAAPEATSEAQTEAQEAPLLIPASAPLLTGRRAVVYVQLPDRESPTFEGRDVELGSKIGDAYEVLSGLEEGELVVTRGAFRIDSELQIRGRPSMMTPTEARTSGEAGLGAQLLAIPPEEIPDPFAAGAHEVLKAYFELTPALADDDAAAARAAATEMRQRLAAVDAGELEPAAAAGWEELANALRSELDIMAAAEELDELRAALGRMAEPIEAVAMAIGEVASIDVYRGTCPMAAGGEQHWIQPNDEIANPYMGQQMPGCGTIEPMTSAGAGASPGDQ